MAATHGHLGEFDSTQEEWELYTECLEQYLTANDVQDPEKQKGQSSLAAVVIQLIDSSKMYWPLISLQVSFSMTLSHK